MKTNLLKKKNHTKIKVPTVSVASDYFKCRSCGHTVRILVRGDTCTCSKCGGTMDRC